MHNNLNAAVRSTGLCSHPDFSVVLQPLVINLVVASPHDGLVARVRPATDLPIEKIRRNLQHAKEIHAAGAPVLAPAYKDVVTFMAEGITQVATLWPLAKMRLVTHKELADLLKNIHTTDPPYDLPRWVNGEHANLRDKELWFRCLANPPSDDVMNRCEYLVEQAMDNLERLLPESSVYLLHGDAHAENVVDYNGELMACDLDSLCVGPREADLALSLVHSRRYPRADPTAGDRLVKAYGSDVNMELLEAIVQVRTLQKLVYLGQLWREPGMAEPGSLDSLMLRLDVMENGGRFHLLHAGERPIRFAEF